MHDRRQAVAQCLRDRDVVAAERSLEAFAEHQAADTRVDAIRADEQIAALDAAVTETDLDAVFVTMNFCNLRTETDVGACANQVVEGRLQIGAAKQNVTAERLGEYRRALAAQQSS